MSAQSIEGMSRCPEWCHGGSADHAQALAEGVDLEDLPHRSGDIAMRLDALHNPHNGEKLRPGGQQIDLELMQAGQPMPFGGLPVIRFAVVSNDDKPQRIVMDLMPGEARSLARMLEHLADQRDLRM